MADPAPAAKPVEPAGSETLVDQIKAISAEEDPKARVDQLFALVSSELAGTDIEGLKELQTTLEMQAGMITRAVEAAIVEIIAKLQADAAAPPVATPKTAAQPSAHAKAPENDPKKK